MLSDSISESSFSISTYFLGIRALKLKSRQNLQKFEFFQWIFHPGNGSDCHWPLHMALWNVWWIIKWAMWTDRFLHPFLAHLYTLALASVVRCHRRCRCHCRCRRRQQCLNIFSSETAWPIKAKLYVEPPWEGGTKVYINGPGHMTKMATMPIYGKNL